MGCEELTAAAALPPFGLPAPGGASPRPGDRAAAYSASVVTSAPSSVTIIVCSAWATSPSSSSVSTP